MVSIGTILTLGIIGAVVAGSYAVYRNIDKIGGAFTRSTQTLLTNPLGDWLDSLSQSSGASSVVTQNGPSYKPLDYVPYTNDPQDSRTWSPGYVPPPEKDFLPPTQQPTPYYPPTQVSPSPKPTPTPKIPSQPVSQPKATYSLEPTKAGYYYVDYEGSKYDTQWKLSAFQAANVAKAAAAPGDAFFGIKYIGQSKLGAQGFDVFGKSQNYL